MSYNESTVATSYLGYTRNDYDPEAFTAEAFDAAMEWAVADRGEDYVYRSPDGDCLYRHNGEPSCLIGTALDYLGIIVPEELELEGASQVLRALASDGAVSHAVADELSVAAVTAQDAQDTGATWGDALAQYKERRNRD